MIDARERIAEYDRLLAFGRSFPHPDGGAAWLGDRGDPLLDRPVTTYGTARMAHVYLLATMTGYDGAGALADRALADLADGRLRDRDGGGWWYGVGGDPGQDRRKDCYAHAFVVLAGASAVVARHPLGPQLLADALQVWIGRFYDEQAGMFADTFAADWSGPDVYRGMNANMHAVEALLAAADALGDDTLWDRARRITGRLVELAASHRWRIPEHYTPDWTPLLDFNDDVPADPFRPYGATIGHALEWSRLILGVEAAGGKQVPHLLTAARQLFDTAVTDGWATDGADGFVYTTGFDGRPVVHDRLHWVVCEGIAAAAALHRRTGEQRYGDLGDTWWAYAKRYLLDLEQGSWHHQLDRENRPVDTVWSGKPDLYHAVQAMLLPSYPPAPSLAVAVRDAGLAVH